MSPTDPVRRFASRGGIKLDAALDAFSLDVTGFRCADLGCSTGGFVDCLLQRGAASVVAVDTAYGELAWKLRQDPRVTVMERTNALHADPPGGPRMDLVTVDLGWTRQAKAIPAALGWLGAEGWIVTLIKPHYEAGEHRMDEQRSQSEARRVAADVLPPLGVRVQGLIPSPIRGGRGKNLEYLALLGRAGEAPDAR